jgi:hypothetical protein
MKNYIKNINDDGVGSPYFLVEEGTPNSIQSNNGLWYVTKEEVENNFPDGTYLLHYLKPHNFEIIIEEVELEFSLDLYKANLEITVDEMVSYILIQYWYKDIGEAAAIAIDENSPWNLEAIKIIDWHNNIYEVLGSYLESVTEENHLEISAFISTLENFEP